MPLVVAGTGTGVGKTLTSALIMAKYARSLTLKYLKPVQTGDDSDRQTVAALTGLSAEFFLPEYATFPLAASPHYAVEQAGQSIDTETLLKHCCDQQPATLIELAGGLMVPLTRHFTNLDLLRQAGFSVLLVCDTGLGTINHSLLSLAALRSAGIFCAGVFFVGRENPLYADNARTICEMGNAAHIGTLFMTGEKLTTKILNHHAADFDREGRIAEAFA